VDIPPGGDIVPVLCLFRKVPAQGLPGTFASLMYSIVIKRMCKQVFLPLT
jgi:hypothetical protein